MRCPNCNKRLDVEDDMYSKDYVGLPGRCQLYHSDVGYYMARIAWSLFNNEYSEPKCLRVAPNGQELVTEYEGGEKFATWQEAIDAI